jgi:hypothetical protein
MYIYTFLLRITDTMTSQNIDLSSWVTLYIILTWCPANGEHRKAVAVVPNAFLMNAICRHLVSDDAV